MKLKESNEFIYIQIKLIEAKKQYYDNHASILTDFQYDMLEKQSYQIAKELGFRSDVYLGPEENEKHHIHWMVGYDPNNCYEQFKKK